MVLLGSNTNKGAGIQQLHLAEAFGHLPGTFQKISQELVWLTKMGLVSLSWYFLPDLRHVLWCILGELNEYIYWYALLSVPEVPLLPKKCEQSVPTP